MPTVESTPIQRGSAGPGASSLVVEDSEDSKKNAILRQLLEVTPNSDEADKLLADLPAAATEISKAHGGTVARVLGFWAKGLLKNRQGMHAITFQLKILILQLWVIGVVSCAHQLNGMWVGFPNVLTYLQ